MVVSQMSDIGLRLKKLRDHFGFSKSQVADYLGFNIDYITKLENNEIKLKSSVLYKLCLIYNCSYEYILKGEGEIIKVDLPEDIDLNTLAEINRIIRNFMELEQINSS